MKEMAGSARCAEQKLDFLDRLMTPHFRLIRQLPDLLITSPQLAREEQTKNLIFGGFAVLATAQGGIGDDHENKKLGKASAF